MCYWFLLPTALLLLQSTSLFHRVQAIHQRPWKTVLPSTGSSGIIIRPTSSIENHHTNGNDVVTSNNKYSSRYNNVISSSVLRGVLTLRAGGDISDDDDDNDNNTTTNSRRSRRKRKRVVKRQEETEEDHPSKKEDEIVDDNDTAAVVVSSIQPNNVDAATTEKKGRRKRRRLFSIMDKVEDGIDPAAMDMNIDDQEDVVAAATTTITTMSSNETDGKRKKRRRKKVVGDEMTTNNEVDESEKEMELESIPNIEVGVAEDYIIPETGKVSDNDDADASPKDGTNTETEVAATRTKKRKRKKRGADKIVVQDTADDDDDDDGKEEETSVDTTPLPLIDASIEVLNEETTSRTKKRKRKKRDTNQTDQDNADDVAKEEETPAADADTTTPPSIDASVDIPSEEIVPESIGSSIEIDKSLQVAPIMDDEEVSSAPSSSEDAVDRIDEEEVEPASSDDQKSITTIDALTGKEENDGESIVGRTDEEIPTEAEIDEMIAQSEETVVDDVVEHIAIDATVEIPEEEIVPESIGASIEVEEDIRAVEEADGVIAQSDVDDDVVEHVAIDATVEIPEEEIVPESIGASIEVEEDIRADAVEEADGGFDDMNEEDEEENEEIDDIPDEETMSGSTINLSDSHESDTPILLSEESVVSSEDNPISTEEVVAAKGTDDGITKDTDEEDEDDDDRDSEENEDNENVEQSTSPPEESEASILSSNEEETIEDLSSADAEETEAGDQPIQPNHESEQEEIVLREEEVLHEDQPSSNVNGLSTQSNEEEEGVVVEVVPSVQLEESNNDVGTITEEETETDQTLLDSIELEKMEDDCLTISVVTWNLGEAAFSEKEASFFKMFRKGDSRIGSDLVLIGAQECEDIKPRRTEGHRSRHLRRVGIQMLGKEYVPLAIHSLGGIQMALYCHRDVLGDVEMVNIADVTCGVGNVFHNKGAIGVYLKMKRLSGKNNDVAKTSRMLFATAHLAAHVKNVDARNDDFKRIISGLESQAPARFLRPKRNADGSPSECDGSYLLKSMDHVIFAGDLNYRVDLPREYVERCIIDIKDNQSCERLEEADALMNKLLRRDQLLQTIASGRAFSQFSEGKITFLPTFKFDKGTQNYDTSHKQRVPAWTDRILFRSSSKVNVLEYQSVPAAMHSDHRPVFGTYQLGWGVSTKVTSREGKRGRRSRKK